MSVEAEKDDPQTAHPARRFMARERATPRAPDVFLRPYSDSRARAVATDTAAGEVGQGIGEGK